MYTRNGSFKRDNVGNLVTGDGDLLNPVITIPSGALKVDIGQDGTVSVLLPGVTQASQVGQIQLTRFDNPSGLVAMGNNLFIDSFASGPPTQGTGVHDRVRHDSTGISGELECQSRGGDGQHDHCPAQL